MVASAGERTGPPVHVDDHRRDAAQRERFPWLTLALGAICVLLFALGKLWSDGNFNLVLYRMGANSGDEVRAGELWRVLASMFLHGSARHIAVNMIALAAFGPVLERLLGPQRYLLLYGLSGLGAGLASALLRGPGISVGASGAIWGLMAAGVGLALRPRGLLPPQRLAVARRRATVPLAINFLYSFSPGVDKWAHFGGGIVGFALMMTGLITLGVDPLWTDGAEGGAVPPRRRSSRGLTLAAIVAAILMAGSVVQALVSGRPWQIAAPPTLTQVRVADTGVVVAVPEVISGAPVATTTGAMQIFLYGKQSLAPVLVEVDVSPLRQPVTDDHIDEFLETMREGLQNATLHEAQRQSDAKIVSVGARRFVVIDHTTRGFERRSWFSVFRDRRVVLRVYMIPDRPAAWRGIEDRIVASLQVP